MARWCRKLANAACVRTTYGATSSWSGKHGAAARSDEALELSCGWRASNDELELAAGRVANDELQRW
jgi:hypothetical protein